MSIPDYIKFVIYGEPASKANSRKLVTIGGSPRFIKSKKARQYVEDFGKQCPNLPQALTCDVSVHITIFYASRRPDLDESIILDAMQSIKKKVDGKQVVLAERVYANDRQVKEKHIYWQLDRDNPRAEIEVREMKVQPLDAA